MRSFATLALMVLTELVSLANAHTWIEQLNLIDATGNMVGEPGFTRGHIFRNDSAFSDALAQHQITGPTVPQDSPMCRDTQQQQQQQPNAGPLLQAPPKAAIALRYLENGHVTQKDVRPRKPANGGTVYVYGTSQPQPTDLLLDIHRVWNADGTGGDGRGKLLSTQNFDDGQCYQVNPASQVYNERVAQFPQEPAGENWCQQDIALPEDATSGLYTLYWVWDWPDMPDSSSGVNQEIYTSCMDIQIADNSDGDVSAFSNARLFVAPQAWNNHAVSSEMADITNPAAVDDAEFTVAFSTTTGDRSAPPSSTATSTSDFGSASGPSTILPIPGFTSSATFTTAIGTTFGSRPTETFNSGSGVPGAPVTPQITPTGQTITVTQFDTVTKTVIATVTAGTTLEKRFRGSEAGSSSHSHPTQTQPQSARTIPQPASTRTCTHRAPRHSHTGPRLRGRKPLFILSSPPEDGEDC